MSKLQLTPRPLQQVAPDAPQFFEEIGKRINVAAVANPTGGATIDTQCRAQLIALMDAMRAAGLLDS